MRYGWNDSLINKVIEQYGEKYLTDRETYYESVEDDLEDHQIIQTIGFTLYLLHKEITLARSHGSILEFPCESIKELFENMHVISYSSGPDTSTKMNLMFDVLELETSVKKGRLWHNQLFGLIKALPIAYRLSTPREIRGETIVVGRRKGSSIDVLVDIYKKTMWKDDPVNMQINSIKEGINYLRKKHH